MNAAARFDESASATGSSMRPRGLFDGPFRAEPAQARPARAGRVGGTTGRDSRHGPALSSGRASPALMISCWAVFWASVFGPCSGWPSWARPIFPALIESGSKLKQFVLANLTALKVPPMALAVIERSEANEVFAVPLRFRPPLSLLTASISKGSVCVAGDALHPMTPDLGQGGCAALEDSVVLARCLGEAVHGEGARGGTESRRIEDGLREYAGIRRWRSVELVATAYVVGFIQQSSNAIVGFLRDRFLSGFLARRLLKMAAYDCGTLWSC